MSATGSEVPDASADPAVGERKPDIAILLCAVDLAAPVGA